MARIHITGASGSGTTTLGAAVAQRLNIPHFDTDDFYWRKTDPPFTTKMPPAERVARLSAMLPSSSGWVFSGSALKWGERFDPLYDLIVFLALDPEVRMARILRRERDRYGQRIEPGGDMAETSVAFLTWAASYDTAGPEQRSRAAHDAWLETHSAPVVKLNSAEPLQALVDAVAWAASSRVRR
ncbi:AAA family ATPase [Aureimonas altamirensis]|uniref:ATP-binding protein n=1 Tax=Aureimonas altamirensis TaxID=370622 RepID=UPI0030180C87